MSEPMLSVRRIKKYFHMASGWFGRPRGYLRAVDGVSFDVSQGETLGLVGESGCGKTTLGRVILGLVRPTHGEVVFEGRNLAAASEDELRAVRKRMQIVFQDPYGSLDPRMTVRSIVEEGLVIHGLGGSDERLARVIEVLRFVGLEPSVLHRYPHEFSGGQRQRIGLARALALSPSFLVCDEPVSALDVSIQSQVVNTLMELKSELSLTLLFISHDLSIVQYVSDRVAVMYLGEIVELARSEELYSNPLHPYTRALLAAVPALEPGQTRSLALKGDVPSPLSPPSGCRFHPRCPLAMDICRSEPPRELDFSGHLVRCHAVEKDLGASS